MSQEKRSSLLIGLTVIPPQAAGERTTFPVVWNELRFPYSQEPTGGPSIITIPYALMFWRWELALLPTLPSSTGEVSARSITHRVYVFGSCRFLTTYGNR